MARPPLEAGHHPETDLSEFCDQDQIKLYETVLGQLIWLSGFIAAGYLQFDWKDGKCNPADILSKHREFAGIWPLLQPLLFWKGDTCELTTKTKGSDRIFTIKGAIIIPKGTLTLM